MRTYSGDFSASLRNDGRWLVRKKGGISPCGRNDGGGRERKKSGGIAAASPPLYHHFIPYYLVNCHFERSEKSVHSLADFEWNENPKGLAEGKSNFPE